MASGQRKSGEGKETLEQLQERMRGALGLLTPFEQEVITMQFGLDGNPAMSLKEVGGRFGIERDDIRQIEAKILRKLRRMQR